MKRPAPVESASALIDEKIKELGDWRGKMLAKVRGIIHQADPEIVEGNSGETRGQGNPGTRKTRGKPGETRGNPGTDGTFSALSVLPVEGDLLLPGISDGCLRAASWLRSEMAMGGVFQSGNEFRRSQRSAGVGTLPKRGEIGFRFSGGEILSPF